MKAAECVLVFTATLVLVVGKPQDLFFPEDSEGPSNRNPQGLRPTTQSQPNPTTPSQPNPITPSTTQASSTAPGSTIRTSRIPSRDPSNRIVYLVSCPCPFTYQYSPVCGTDGQVYGNMGVLQCARQCGKEVEVYLMGACGSNNG